MKLLYTDVRTPLTQVLTQEAVGLVEQGEACVLHCPTLFPLKRSQGFVLFRRSGFFCHCRHALCPNGPLFHPEPGL